MNTKQSRRTFARMTTAFVAGGAVLPNIFLNKTLAATGENPSELIRIGIIGTGGQGTSNMRSVIRNVVAVCDVDSAHAAAAAALVEKTTKRKPAVFDDYRKLLEDKSIDAVLVATPDHWHTLPSLHACQAGKDVYCEKPLTLFIDEGKALVKAARENKRVFQTGSQQRSSANFLKAAEYVRNGLLGNIKRVYVGLPGVNWTKEPAVPDSAPPPELNYDMWLGPAPTRPYNKQRVHYYFRFFWDYSGGQMTNWGAHHLDIAQWALGMDESGPVEIAATAKFDPEKRFETPVDFQITYKYADGVIIQCKSPPPSARTMIPGHEAHMEDLLGGKGSFTGCIFEGEKGLLYVNRGALHVWPEEIFSEPIKSTDVRLYASTNHHQNWLSCIKSRKSPICDVAIGHRSATVCHLGNMAVRHGKPIRWDPAAEAIVGDAAAAAMVRRDYRAPWKLPLA